jgi:hypothetical protein
MGGANRLRTGPSPLLAVLTLSLLLLATTSIGATSVLAGTPTTTTILYYPTSPIVANASANFTAKVQPSVAGRTVDWLINGALAATDLTNPNGVSQVSFAFGPGGQEIKAILEAGPDYDRSESTAVLITVTPDPTMALDLFSFDQVDHPVTTLEGSDVVVSINRASSGPSRLEFSASSLSGDTVMRVRLAAPNGSALDVGTYLGADSPPPDLSHPDLWVITNSTGCGSPSTGAFQILSMRRDSAGVPVSFALSFEYLCEGAFWPLVGRVRYNAATPISNLDLPETSPWLDPVVVGETGAPHAFPMKNDGEEPVAIGQLAIAGSDASDSDLTADTCSGVTLAPAASCSFSLTSHPSRAGRLDSTIVIPSDAPLSPRSLAIGEWGLIATAVLDPVAIADNQYFIPGVRYEARVSPNPQSEASECFVDDVRLDGSIPDANGHVACVAPRPTLGGHQLRIHYLGGATYGGSWSEPVGFTVDPSTGTILTASKSTARANESIHFDASVVFNGSLAYSGGTLTLSDATTGEMLGIGSVDATSPSIAVDRAFTPGSHHVVASYSGVTSVEDPSSGSIDLTILEPDTSPPSGSIAIAGGGIYVTSAIVSLLVTASDTPSSVAQVALSNDGVSWTLRSYDASQSWTLSAGDGMKTVYARWQDGAGNWSSPVSGTIVLDTVAPNATGPTKGFVSGSSLPTGRPTIRFSWSGSDATSGIDRYELALSTDAGAYSTLSGTLASPTFTRTLAAGHAYRARVRAIDSAGNVGAWAYGASFRLAAYQESSRAIHWTGTWRSGSSTSYWGGHDRYATSSGAKASLTFSGRSFAWVGSVGPTRGWARVYVNGILVRSINLNAASSANRRILFATNWSSTVSRTITIRIAGTAGHPRGDIDAFLTGS